MPFNRAMMMPGPRTFILTSITAEDLSFTYNVEAQVVSQFGISGTQFGDNIMLSIGAVKLLTLSLGLDADGLHDDAIFTLNIVSGTKILGRGGSGGKGGDAEFDPEPPHVSNVAFAGSKGKIGSTPIRLGCTTFIKGAGGNIELGYGGGGGGGGDFGPPAGGGGGGGGGAPDALGGSGGFASGGAGPTNGSSGSAATETGFGSGGAGGRDAGAGGDGGDVDDTQTAGTSADAAGGAAGSDGKAISKQGFDVTIDGGITVVGAVS